MAEEKKTPLEMAVELDEMEKSVSSSEADFLEEVLKALKAGKRLKPKDRTKLEEMHKKHLGEPEPDEKELPVPKEDEEELPVPKEAEEEVEDEDFV